MKIRQKIKVLFARGLVVGCQWVARWVVRWLVFLVDGRINESFKQYKQSLCLKHQVIIISQNGNLGNYQGYF